MKPMEGEVEGVVVHPLTAVAHELKTPLVLLRQLSQQLEEELSAVAADSETLRRMKLTTERALRLCDNLTKVARLDDALFAMEPVQLDGLCQEVADEMTPLGQALRQEIKYKALPRKGVIAMSNREILRTLLTGLVDNALHYNRDKRLVEIRARSRKNGQKREVVLSVRDHGAVMDIGEFRTLETSIGQQATPISSRPLSSGLGLLIAGKFASAMGGDLQMQRHYSGGLTLSVRLPVVQQLSLLEAT